MVDTLTREKSGATAIGEPIGNRKIRIMVQNRLLHGQLSECHYYSGCREEAVCTLYRSVSKIEKGAVSWTKGADIGGDGEEWWRTALSLTILGLQITWEDFLS